MLDVCVRSTVDSTFRSYFQGRPICEFAVQDGTADRCREVKLTDLRTHSICNTNDTKVDRRQWPFVVHELRVGRTDVELVAFLIVGNIKIFGLQQYENVVRVARDLS